MKKRNKIIFLIITIFVVASLTTYFTVFGNNSNDSGSGNNVIKDEITKGDTPDKNEPYKETTTIENPNSEKGEEVELKYDQYVVANGYAGASDDVYYTRNNVLYHLVLSTNTSTRLAEGVGKIEDDIDTVIVHKKDNFKLVNEDNYVTYVD